MHRAVLGLQLVLGVSSPSRRVDADAESQDQKKSAPGGMGPGQSVPRTGVVASFCAIFLSGH